MKLAGTKLAGRKSAGRKSAGMKLAGRKLAGRKRNVGWSQDVHGVSAILVLTT